MFNNIILNIRHHIYIYILIAINNGELKLNKIFVRLTYL